MADGKVLEFRGVTKIFGDVAAVSDFTARVEPGVVTGFVGPNGAGKSTTLRILLGDIAPTQGTALIDGVVYKKLSNPRRTVGALLENTPYKPRRTAERHLILAARAIGVPVSRVDEVLEVVGLGGVGDMRIGGFSLGMRQRLGVAEALLGDPDVLIFDEPANGLDPEGIRWMRLLMRRLADEGRTVLMSSHVLSEVQQVADNILIISNGRLLFSGGIEQLADSEHVVAVDSPQRAALRDVLRENGYEFELLRSGINVLGTTPAEIGALAAQAGVPLSSLALKQQSLEDVFLKIVNGTWQGPATDEDADVAAEPAGEVPPMPAAVVAEEADSSASAADDAVSADETDAGDALEDDATVTDADSASARTDAGAGVPAMPLAVVTEADTMAPMDPQPSLVPVPGASAAPADDHQPLATVIGTAAVPTHDPLAFMSRPLSEVERDVEAGEAQLIAASPDGEQPTPGWLPAHEDVPFPAEEDADDPDPLETADETIELPEGEPAEFADAGEDADPVAADGAVEEADEPAAGDEIADEVIDVADEDDPQVGVAQDDADHADALETADETIEDAGDGTGAAPADGGDHHDEHRPHTPWPGLAEYQHSREHD